MRSGRIEAVDAAINGIPIARFEFPQRCPEFPQRCREFSLSFPSAQRSGGLGDRRIHMRNQHDGGGMPAASRAKNARFSLSKRCGAEKRSAFRQPWPNSEARPDGLIRWSWRAAGDVARTKVGGMRCAFPPYAGYVNASLASRGCLAMTCR